MSGQLQVGREWPLMFVHNKKQFKQIQAKNKNKKQTNFLYKLCELKFFSPLKITILGTKIILFK